MLGNLRGHGPLPAAQRRKECKYLNDGRLKKFSQTPSEFALCID
jgi:hypothetical protein